MLKTNTHVQPRRALEQFAEKCKQSKTWQGDGWGIALKNKNGWKIRKGLKPIWEEYNYLRKIPKSEIFIVHARSASFDKHRGKVEYNQPYTKNGICFVFNGLVHKVNMNKVIPGRIGAQKIFSLLTDYLHDLSPEVALKKINNLILGSSERTEGLNVGLSFNGNLYALCQYDNDADYFTLYYSNEENKKIICSVPLSGTNFKKFKRGQVLSL